MKTQWGEIRGSDGRCNACAWTITAIVLALLTWGCYLLFEFIGRP